MKRCPKCGLTQSRSDFHKRARASDGLNEWCKSCALANVKAHYVKNGERIRAYVKEWSERNKDRVKKSHAAYRLEHIKEEKERIKKRRLADPERHNRERREWALANKDSRKKTSKKYYENNKAKYAAWVRQRQAAQLKRLPLWANKKEISLFYRDKPAGMEVDHIIPLRGKNVSGLHVIENLQYLTMEQNRRKFTSFSQNY